MKPNFYKTKEKVIRDPVHGNITFDSNFIKIIDTPEFQRLRRIRQLSTATMIFPTAEHTRFTHSIGTYHVMKLIINHFRGIFEEFNKNITDESVNLALAVALLHDIGHGPFSHAFEEAFPEEQYKKRHVAWTVDIITSPDSEVNKVLVNSFGTEFPGKVASLIQEERKLKHNKSELKTSDDINLFFILSSLISSQLDADRMDYLLRDAFFTGVTYGNFDIERLIKALTLTVNTGKYYVCIHEKYLSTVEEYVTARYQMHDSVYYHPFKVQTEIISKKILQRAYELYKKRQLDTSLMPQSLVSLFEGNDISVSEYTTLDDSLLISLFSQWKTSNDKILSLLSSAFLDRNKFRELNILNNSEQDLINFELELISILEKHGYKNPSLDKEYFWISKKSSNVVYKNNKENILILCNDGTLKDLMDVSKIIKRELNKDIFATYINLDLLKLNNSINNQNEVIKEIESLINMYNNRNHIEIEQKYYFQDTNIFKNVLTILKAWNEYALDESADPKKQIDTYYDTPDRLLCKSDRTLRIREKNGSYTLTIKIATANVSEENDTSKKEIPENKQNERFEYEIKVPCSDLSGSEEYIKKYLPEFSDDILYKKLSKTLVISNNRRKILLTRANAIFEMAFDNVTYHNAITGKEHSEHQIEIELKSEFLHRVNLKLLTDYIESKVTGLTPTTKSKYKRGLSATE